MPPLRFMTEPELSRLMNQAADAVKAVLPRKTLFVVLVFDDPGLGQYISNCDRSTMVACLRETADRLERRETIDRMKFPE